MSLDIGIGFNFGKSEELFGQGHFVVVIMNTVVTESTNKYPLVEFMLRVGFLETSSAMQFFGDQMMEG